MPAEQIPLSFDFQSPDSMLRSSKQFHEKMRTRRSVRQFAPDPVSRTVIENCLAAANTAPSGANLQPWHFVAIADPAVKRRIREAAETEERAFYAERAPEAWLRALEPIGTNAEKPFLETAPWLIAVFSVHTFSDGDGVSRSTYYPKESVGIATGFLLTALHHAGLATLTHTPSPMHFLNRILGRPANEKPFLLVVTGKPAADATVPRLARKPLDMVATFIEPSPSRRS